MTDLCISDIRYDFELSCSHVVNFFAFVFFGFLSFFLPIKTFNFLIYLFVGVLTRFLQNGSYRFVQNGVNTKETSPRFHR